MASLSTAWSSTLGVVTKTATTVTNVVDTIDQGSAMLNDMARNARRHAKLASAGREAGFEAQLEATIARDATALEDEIEDWLSTKSEATKTRYLENLTKVRTAIAAAKASL